MTPSDSDLLRRYARARSEAAFSALVARHVDLVHAAALRQVREHHLAREVSQTVFIELARHAHALGSVRVLSAWLYTLTRRRAIDMIRRESRRRTHESPSADPAATEAVPAPETIDWTQTAPLLDEAMQSLSEEERAAVLLRYFENRSLREVGLALGVSDDAAQKRVHRALERLRAFFTRRRLPLNAAGLAALLSGHAVAAAPAGLATTITSLAAGQAAAGLLTVLPSLLMPSLGKTLAVSAIALGLGFGLYEQQQARALGRELAELRARQSQADRRHADQLARLDSELVRLRSAAAKDEAEAASSAKDPAIAEMASWLERLQNLRAHLQSHPELAIPEFQLLDESDWLDACKGKLGSPENYRRAAASLRSTAEHRFGSRAQKAMKKYAQAHAGALPATAAELAPWFDSPVDSAMLDRWVMLPAKDPDVANIGVGSDRVFTQKTFVDDEIDMRRVFGPDGSGATGVYPSAKQLKTLEKIATAYSAAHPGSVLVDASALLPYATTPEEKSLVQRQIARLTAAGAPAEMDPLVAAAVAYAAAHPGRTLGDELKLLIPHAQTPAQKAALQKLVAAASGQ